MVGIYFLEKNHFLFCSSKLRNVLGDNGKALIQKGWDCWYAMIAPNEATSVKNHISRFLNIPSVHDRLTIRYHITDFNGKNIFIKHEIILRKLEKYILAINYFFDVTEKEKIEQHFESISVLKNAHSKHQKKLNISAREKEVLQLVADGYSSKEIAGKLFISNHTAISHRKNLIEKFQVKNTAHLIKRATELIPAF